MKVLEITDSTFEDLVLKSREAVLLEFGAPWCPPCRAMIPVLEALAKETNGRALIGKMDVDENPISVAKYGIRNLPTMLIFKNGEPVVKMVGAGPKHHIYEKLSVWI